MNDHQDPVDVVSGSTGLPILGQFSDGGFVDCVFRIQDHECVAGKHRFHLAAEQEGREVGFDAVVLDGIRGGFDSNMELVPDRVYRGGVQFARSGIESDRLVAALEALCGLRVTGNRMAEAASFTAIALHDVTVDLRSGPTTIKLFGHDGESDSERDYFESFFRLDLKNGWVLWNEKDPEYREALVRGISAASSDSMT